MANIQELVINKEHAAEWLKKNGSNRSILKTHVAFLQSQMDAGEWQFAADPIRFSGNFERLIDGQHRLTAFIQSILPEIKLLVVSGLNESAFDTMDTGKARTAGDVLGTYGYENPTNIAAAVKMALLIKKGGVALKATLGVNNKKSKSSTTNHAVKLFVEQNPAIIDACKQGKRFYNDFPSMSPAEYSAFYFLFSEKDANMAFDFFNSFSKGSNLSELSPVFALRKKMESNKLSSTKMIGKMKQSLIIQAWNLYRRGKEVKRLQFNPGDALPEIL